jgi:hypothetical protein
MDFGCVPNLTLTSAERLAVVPDAQIMMLDANLLGGHID